MKYPSHLTKPCRDRARVVWCQGCGLVGRGTQSCVLLVSAMDKMRLGPLLATHFCGTVQYLKDFCRSPLTATLEPDET